ncbi:hypothetical protein [Brachyspira sp.]|uniref:hypothetical protein n=1 Tax=Brachyspira sp. TaxID=1977261 RepID=UPI003D7E0EE5
MKKIFIIILFTNSFLYSQIYPVVIPDFKDFLGNFINANLDYLVVSNEIMKTVLTSKELENLYKDGMKDFTETELVNIKNNPNKIFEYTTNESLILMGGTVLAVFETVKTQYNLNMALLDKFQKRLSFLAGSGNNYGMIIPMRTPLFSLAMGLYTDFPSYSKKNKTVSDNYYHHNFINGLDAVPMPYFQVSGQANLWKLPVSLGFRADVLLGTKDLYSQFVRDIEMEASGFSIGGEIKTLIWRNDYFFLDLRADINYNMGTFKSSLEKEIYIPITLGYLGGTDTGVLFDANPGFDASWKTFFVAPKLTFGFKMKDRVPYVQYLGASFSISYDSSFIDINIKNYIKSSSAYANIEGYSKILTDIKFYDFETKKNLYYGDLRFNLTLDVFYMSLSLDYAVFSKMWSLMIIPVLIRI